MSKQTINIGASPNDGTGTPLRTSFDFTNQNFTELYTALGGGVGLPGATTQVIFNDGGTNLAGDAGLVYNKTTDALTVAGLVTAGSATITGDLTAARWFLTGGSLPGLGNSYPFAYRIGGGGLGIGAATETGTTAPIVFYCGAGGVEQYRIAPLGVFTWTDGAGGTRMTLNSTGLGVGTASPGFKLVVAAASGNVMQFENTSDSSRGGRITNTGTAGTGKFGITTTSSGYGLSFGIDAVEKMLLDTSGNLGVGVTPAGTGGCLQLKSGIPFPATQVAASDANTLDDYEEGTWTIGLTFGGASTGMTTFSNSGTYTKVGRQVTLNGYISLSNKGSATGAALITGLPFTIGSASNNYSAASLYLVTVTFADYPMGYGNINTTTIILQELTNAGVRSNLTEADFANNSEIIFTLTYFV